MKIISMPRGMGKTKVLVEWVKCGRKNRDAPGSGNRILLVHTKANAINLRELYELSDNEIRVYHKNLYDLPGGSEVAIDEIGLFLEDRFPSNTEVVCISTSPEEVI